MPEVSDPSESVTASVRKEARSQIAKFLIAAIVALLLAAATGWWTILKPALSNAMGGVPSGAVVAFDLGPDTPCPVGWRIFQEGASRMIIGAGNPAASGNSSEAGYAKDDNGRALNPKKYREHGGEEVVQLTIPELPAHTHEYQTLEKAMKQDGLDTAVWVGSKTVESASTGEDEAHNNLPPYIALYYCKKN